MTFLFWNGTQGLPNLILPTEGDGMELIELPCAIV